MRLSDVKLSMLYIKKPIYLIISNEDYQNMLSHKFYYKRCVVGFNISRVNVEINTIRILSSIILYSNLSIIEAATPAITPEIPAKMYPNGAVTAAMAIFPIQCLVLFLNNVFLTIPVAASPRETNNAGKIEIQGLLSMIHKMSTEDPHAIQKLTSYKLSFV